MVSDTLQISSAPLLSGRFFFLKLHVVNQSYIKNFLSYCIFPFSEECLKIPSLEMELRPYQQFIKHW